MELKKKLKIILAYFAIYFIWGSTFLAIRYAIDSIPPFIMVGFRTIIAGAILFIFSIFKNKQYPSLIDWKKATISGFILIVFGYGGLTWAQQFVPSGYASLLEATLSIWLFLLYWIYGKKYSPSPKDIIGIMAGFIGVVLLLEIDGELITLTKGNSFLVFLSSFALLISAFSWASGSFLSHKIKSIPLMMLIGMQLLTGGFFMLLIATLVGEWVFFSPKDVSILSLVSLLYLIFFGTIIAFGSYSWLLRVSSPVKVGSYAFFNPLVAVFLGWLLANEQITRQMIIGALAILVSVLILNFSQTNKLDVEKRTYN
ncbi:MAG: hypothetical protein D8M58_17895 [Calditrichaeota bacterium]|nr:MAG: hypothetical protein DWQ03_01810 [Calditrichota bacterium]MBL1207281.1 hypothetical protein [Calditrichota bacterium]NOG47113.1 EamA family transporter [Calditrichota bacterium]